jgi:hypothetical protein
MAGVFTSITDDIIVQEGTFGFSFIASSAISGGQLVKSAGPVSAGGLYVTKATDANDNAIGVAAYTKAKNEAVTVYGPGNIIRGCAASSTTQSDDLFVGADGMFNNSLTYGGTYPSIGISLETKAAGAAMRILLK